ncbi:MAG: dihydrodipicolinate synthase family protein [Candidatus Thermoplasmatota archaeon]|nr:dihydrodipicolinate synthase family protein [Candidatus Thermoplasmatota archaeon]
MNRELRGIWAPMPTPLTRKGEVDVESLRVLVNHLITGGIDGLFPLGTAGEFALLSPDERRLVTDTVVDAANGRVPVFAGVSDPSTENIIAFAKQAIDVGVDGIIATPPYYYTTSEDALYRHFRLLHSKLPVPIVVYNIPSFTHIFIPVRVVSRLAEEGCIAGMKYTEYNLYNLITFISETRKKIAIFTGSDAMAYSCLDFGGSGAIIGVSNVAPKMAAGIYDYFVSGRKDRAREMQIKLMPAISAIGMGEFPAGLKEAVSYAGMNVGKPKEPIPDVTPEQRREIHALLNRAGIRRHR